VTSSAPVPNDISSLTAQIDEPDFNAEAYVGDLLKTAGLRDIIRTENALVSEVRNLDGERKALVYDNYSKLIKAVGTIAEMQKGMHKKDQQYQLRLVLGRQQEKTIAGLDGVEKVGERFDSLLKIVKELQPQHRQQSDVQANKARILKRQKVTVRWALDAPSRLQELLDKQEREEAKRQYGSVVEVLDQWKGLAGVDDLRARCAEIMEISEHKHEEDKLPETGEAQDSS
jgi:hypothetical protein